MIKNKMFWVYVSFSLAIIFGLLANWFPLFERLLWIPIGYLLGLGLVMIFYAIKNTIKDLKDK